MPQCGQKLLVYPEVVLQECPLCGTKHPIFVQGIAHNPENRAQYMPILDRGYSFCNCSNIFYTDWSNTDPRIYDEQYRGRYQHPNYKEAIRKYAQYFPRLKALNPGIKKFAEIGMANEVLLDEAKKEGWETIGIDINPGTKSDNHRIMIWNVEDGLNIEDGPKFDVVWASHIFEHFHYPLKVAQNVFDSLNSDGLLFVAMPDPWYIEWTNPHLWQHWVIREHHIIWDMESFVEKLEAIGFKKEFHKRNEDGSFICSGDYHLIFRKP